MKVNLLSANSFRLNQAQNLFSIFRNSDEVTKLIEKSGYKGEKYQVKSKDGYHLTVHRVLSNKRIEPKGSVFLMHGLFRNSTDYLATGPQTALPYLLSDHGFDCYLGNARGNKYCTKHDVHPYDSKDFWNFSWEQIGLYDLPAMLELALHKSGSSKIHYIGHSQGGTTVLALLASKPEHNKMLSQIHLMAPAVYLGGSSIVYNFMNRFMLRKLEKHFYKFDITPLLKFVNKFSQYNLQNPERMITLYKSVTCRFVGKNKGEVQLSMEALKTFNHFMSPVVSIQQINHYQQLYKSRKFQKFDHGDKNKDYYGTSTPPEFILSNVIAPTYLYHAEEDSVVDKTGMDRLARELPNVQHYKILHDFNHVDLMLGKNARELVYKDILKFLRQ